MNTLIKLSDEHFIIVDDSLIKESDWYIDDTNTVRQSITSDKDYWSRRVDYKKITHSTQSLDGIKIYKDFDDWFENQSQEQLEEFEKEFGYYGHDIGTSLEEWKGIYKEKNPVKHISLSEVEEAIYGYSVEKMTDNYLYDTDEQYPNIDKNHPKYEIYRAYKNGFKAHQELVKDKLFTVKDMQKSMDFMYWFCQDVTNEYLEHNFNIKNAGDLNTNQAINTYIQSLLIKTELEIEFDEKGKLKIVNI